MKQNYAAWGNHDIIFWRYQDNFGPYDMCECDLNTDGVCDMQDYFIFSQDWGEEECPAPQN